MRTLLELAQTLPALAEPLKLANDADVSRLAFDPAPNPVEGYVWPNLQDWQEGNAARILVVRAPGAVGKSAAAATLASRLRWPLINAAKAQVGSYSMTGLIQDSLGLDSTYIQEVMTDRGGIIVDALDEAHLKAGTANFIAFLDNIRKLAGVESADARATIILFSRPDTAEFVEQYFIEEGAPVATCSISFFTNRQSNDFITAYMTSMSSTYTSRNYDVASRHPKAFAELRDFRMQEIAEVLLAEPVSDVQLRWRDVREFLGYAPVLAVVAEFLAVPNPLVEKTKKLSPRYGATGVLLQIIDQLLDREQKKFVDQVKFKLEADLPADEVWDEELKFYGKEEQSVRLVAQVLRCKFVVPLPARMPETLRESYDRHVNQWLADHPFLAGNTAVNSVFSDFIMARAAVDPVSAMSLLPEPKSRVRDFGPFFFQFVHQFASKSAGIGDPVISEDLVLAIIDSHTQSTASHDAHGFVFFQSEEAGTLILYQGMMDRSASFLSYEVVDLSGAFSISDRLPRGSVLTDAGVIIGTKDRNFLLGPYARVEAAEIAIMADSISVDPGPSKAGPSVLSAPNITVSGPLSISAPKKDSLVVSTDDPWPVFRPYVFKDAYPRKLLPTRYYMDLRSILRVFDKGGGDRPAVFGEKLEQRIVKDSVTRRHYLERLQELQIIISAGPMYYLDTDRLAEYGLDIRAVSSGELTEVVGFFVDMLNEGLPQASR